MLSSFAILAAVGFVAAYIVPTTVAAADAAVPERALSAYDQQVNGAQSLIVADSATTAQLSRESYEMYVTPTPTPTPEPKPQPADDGGGDSGSGNSGGSGDSGDSGGGYDAPPQYSGGGSPEEWMSAAGIAESDWGYVDYIVSRESSWNPNATNPGSGACGLVQALPCSKVGGAGGYDPVANLQWGNGYAVGRYGSWANAYAFWVNNHWW